MNLKRIGMSLTQKQTLEQITGNKIYLRNSFSLNQKEIQGLADQAITNAKLYLERNRLGQKLSIFDENRLFSAIVELGQILGMKDAPRKIECYDISHIQGKFVYGSMVVFVDGRPVNKYYRLFKCKDQNDDFANHAEVMSRRLKRGIEYTQNPKEVDKAWKLPDLIIVDGGKGQLSADFSVLTSLGLQNQVAMVSLAKNEEEIFSINDLDPSLPRGKQGGVLLSSEPKFLVQRIRDEAHRFAIKNNRQARLKTIQKSSLDQVAGIGNKTKTKILKRFGSVENLMQNLIENPDLVYETVGKNITEKLREQFNV
jgi:excinuclease ABC subunit C